MDSSTYVNKNDYPGHLLKVKWRGGLFKKSGYSQQVSHDEGWDLITMWLAN